MEPTMLKWFSILLILRLWQYSRSIFLSYRAALSEIAVERPRSPAEDSEGQRRVQRADVDHM